MVLAGHAGAITGLALCPPHGETSTVSGSGSGFGSFRVVAGCDDGVLGAWRFTSRTPTSSSSGVPTSSSGVPTSSSGVPGSPTSPWRWRPGHARAGAVRATLVVARWRAPRVRREDKPRNMVSTNRPCLSRWWARARPRNGRFSPCGAYLALGAADSSLSVAGARAPGGDEKEGLVGAAWADERDFDRYGSRRGWTRECACCWRATRTRSARASATRGRPWIPADRRSEAAMETRSDSSRRGWPRSQEIGRRGRGRVGFDDVERAWESGCRVRCVAGGWS